MSKVLSDQSFWGTMSTEMLFKWCWVIIKACHIAFGKRLECGIHALP